MSVSVSVSVFEFVFGGGSRLAVLRPAWAIAWDIAGLSKGA